MGVVIIEGKLTREMVKTALEEYPNYIKITIDLEQKLVAIGGQYHANAEDILIKKFGSKHSKTWGGGYDLYTKAVRTDAMLNFKPNYNNNSSEILDPLAREQFLKLTALIVEQIKSFL